jgi:hypothetical protein
VSRGRHVTPSRTAERIERIRTLITTLLCGQILRDDIGAVLRLSPSGVRSYLADLRGKVELVYEAGVQVCRLAIGADEAKSYLASLDLMAPSRPIRPRMSKPTVDPSRHIHIMQDDVDFPVRVHRGIPAHEPMMAHFFNLAPAGVWA